jgi:hypothetical protein
MWNLFIGLIAVMLANVFFGASLAKLKQEFNKENLLNGLFKIFTIVTGTGLIYLCGYLNPNIMVVEIQGNIVNLIEGIRLIAIAGIVFYGAKSLSKLIETIKINTAVKSVENTDN